MKAPRSLDAAFSLLFSKTKRLFWTRCDTDCYRESFLPTGITIYTESSLSHYDNKFMNSTQLRVCSNTWKMVVHKWVQIVILISEAMEKKKRKIILAYFREIPQRFCDAAKSGVKFILLKGLGTLSCWNSINTAILAICSSSDSTHWIGWFIILLEPLYIGLPDWKSYTLDSEGSSHLAMVYILNSTKHLRCKPSKPSSKCKLAMF